MYEPPDTYEEEKPEKNDIFHESAPPPQPDEKNLGDEGDRRGEPHCGVRRILWCCCRTAHCQKTRSMGRGAGSTGIQFEKEEENVFSGQRDSYEREYVIRPDPYDPLLSWEQNQEMRFKKNMISSNLLKKHRINVAKKPEEGEGEGDDQ